MDVLPANCYLFIYLFSFACRFFFLFPPMRSLVSKGTVMGKKSLSLFPASALLRLNFLPHLCTLLCPQQAKVLHTLLCLETPSERAIKQENNSFVFFCLLCVLCSESGHYTVNILACVAWRFCRAGRRSGVAAKFAREARENERRSREKNKNFRPNLLAVSLPSPAFIT